MIRLLFFLKYFKLRIFSPRKGALSGNELRTILTSQEFSHQVIEQNGPGRSPAVSV